MEISSLNLKLWVNKVSKKCSKTKPTAMCKRSGPYDWLRTRKSTQLPCCAAIYIYPNLKAVGFILQFSDDFNQVLYLI